MKTVNSCSRWLLLFLLLLLPAAAKSAEKPKATDSKTAPAPVVPDRSVFILPLNPLQGRDPFFPNSSRPYEEVAPGHKTENVSALVIKGFVGSGPGRMAIINNHTFAAGDEGDVLTSQGRIHIRCVDVRGDRVFIEVDGQIHELKFHDDL